MPNSSKTKVTTAKVWYKSKTIWLLVSQLLVTFAGVITKDIGLTSAIAISMTTISGFIVRYYTEQGITLKNNINS